MLGSQYPDDPGPEKLEIEKPNSKSLAVQLVVMIGELLDASKASAAEKRMALMFHARRFK